jgi:hypothetical protein
VFAALSPVIARCEDNIDRIILADWSHNDYKILLELIYGQTDRWVNSALWEQCTMGIVHYGNSALWEQCTMGYGWHSLYAKTVPVTVQ